METKETIKILEALISGCSPTTGEVIGSESVLNERNVIRALQIAIEQLKIITKVQIDKNDIEEVTNLFKEQKYNPTANRLAGFFLGTKKFKNKLFLSNHLYGKYHNSYTRGQLLDFFTQYLYKNNRTNNKRNLYEEIDFFQKETFNRLSEKAIVQLKEKVEELGIQKTENLSEYVENARVNCPRAFESWSEKERQLLKKAIEYTNDLDLLSRCFQRGKRAIESCGQKLIYKSQNLEDDKKQN